MLNINQITAINNSKKNDFSSGIHFHATGTENHGLLCIY